MSINKSGITTFALVMFIAGAVDSIRNLPPAALFGSTLIFFYIFSAIVFLIPTALMSAELAARSEEHSGIFHWVKRAFGEKWAFLAIWMQWISNLVWFPTILSFVAGLVAYIFKPELAQNKIYLVTCILILFWSLTILNFRGLRVSAKFTSFCALFGLVIPMLLIMGLSFYWIMSGRDSQIHFTLQDIFPSFSNVNSWTSLTAIMTAFAGMELAAVHVKDIRDPQKTFPKALYYSVWIILISMIFGSLGIAIVLPNAQISLVNGIMQTFSMFFDTYHIAWVTPIMSLFILIGSLGGIVSWVISPAKGLLQAGQLGFLPAKLTQLNKHGVAQNLLIMQATIVSVVCIAFLSMPSVSGSYWLLTALSTQLYVLMYVLMFIAGLSTRFKMPNPDQTAFKIPGGTIGIWLVSALGFLGCAITLFVGFIPPAGLNVGGFLHYELIFWAGLACMLLPILVFYRFKSRSESRLPRV